MQQDLEFRRVFSGTSYAVSGAAFIFLLQTNFMNYRIRPFTIQFSVAALVLIIPQIYVWYPYVRDYHQGSVTSLFSSIRNSIFVIKRKDIKEPINLDGKDKN